MAEKGKLIIRFSKKNKLICEVDIGKKQPMKIPDFYDIKDDSLNGKECLVERNEQGEIIKILVDGNELPKKNIYPNSLSKGAKKKINIKRQSDSFDPQKAMLPYDTQNILKKFNKVENFHLKLNKCARFEGDKFKFFKTDRWKILYKINPAISKDLIPDISEHYYNDIEKIGYELKSIELKPDWRVIIGLGNPSVYEISMTLHHIYGIPYIPGSAIKGVVRNYIISEEFERDEDKALQDERFCMIFGSPKKSKIGEHKGSVIFFDAFPLEIPQIEPDVMNVHYPDYYSGTQPPTDSQNPNPIYFLTVRNTKFKFVIGIKNKKARYFEKNKEMFNKKTILEYTLEKLKKSLSEYGIGAKTAVGYGIMQIID